MILIFSVGYYLLFTLLLGFLFAGWWVTSGQHKLKRRVGHFPATFAFCILSLFVFSLLFGLGDGFDPQTGVFQLFVLASFGLPLAIVVLLAVTLLFQLGVDRKNKGANE